MRTDSAVIDAMYARRDGSLKKGRKIGMLLPGGGMNGVYAGGVMQTLAKFGMTEVFDVIYGYSSGAATGAYLLSGNPTEGSSIYSQDLCGFSFMQPWRPYNWMNTSYFSDVMHTKKPLNVNRVINASTILQIQVTEIDSGRTRFISNRDNVDIINTIIASCSFPGFAPPVELNGKLYCDGGVTQFITIDQMVKDGCTDILVVPTVPEYYRRPKTDVIHSLSRIFLREYGNRFRTHFNNIHVNYNTYMRHVFGEDMPSNTNVYVLAPDYHLSPMATNAGKLRKYETHGVHKANIALTMNR